VSEHFIGIYENAFSKDYCERAIKYFKTMDSLGYTKTRKQLQDSIPVFKDDKALFMHDETVVHLTSSGALQKEFNDIYWQAYNNDYSQRFGSLQRSDPHNNYCFKIKEIKIGAGYHIWHYESSSRSQSNRVLTWQIYLNDVEEGGETEFLYQRMRIKPKQGTLLIWPSGFTHTHRGNPPYSNDKYIISGWTEF
jgi:hypothetical protein